MRGIFHILLQVALAASSTLVLRSKGIIPTMQYVSSTCVFSAHLKMRTGRNEGIPPPGAKDSLRRSKSLVSWKSYIPSLSGHRTIMAIFIDPRLVSRISFHKVDLQHCRKAWALPHLEGYRNHTFCSERCHQSVTRTRAHRVAPAYLDGRSRYVNRSYGGHQTRIFPKP